MAAPTRGYSYLYSRAIATVISTVFLCFVEVNPAIPQSKNVETREDSGGWWEKCPGPACPANDPRSQIEKETGDRDSGSVAKETTGRIKEILKQEKELMTK